jgi:outer membrane receptor protein involved in Fe transport
VVTGSRIITNGNNMPTPVTVVSTESMQTVQPTTLSDNLNYLPEFNGSQTQTARPINAFGGANELNLRGLGANRNLLLMDGHRIPPTLVNGAVDSDMVPQMLVQRVDVVTGGVSAVYGSDAISGVINFVMDRNLNQLKVRAQGGISGYGDDAQEDVGIAYGTSLLDGRAHIEGSVEFRNDAGISRKSERPWDTTWAIVGIGTTQFPFYLSPNVRIFTASLGGLISTGVLSGQNFTTNGVLTAFQHGTFTGSTTAEVGGDGYYDDGTFKATLLGKQAFLRGDYDITDNIHAFVDFSGVQKTNKQFQAPLFLNAVTMGATNAYLAPAYQAQLAAAKQTTFKFNKYALLDSPRKVAEGVEDSYMFNAGVNGTFDEFHWDLYAQHGWTKAKSITQGNVNNQKLFAALDAVVNPANGQIVCNVTLTNPNADPGCVPMNVFGPNTITKDAFNYVNVASVDTIQTTMDDVEASVTGPLLDLWAGPLSGALSGEWRHTRLTENNTAPTSLLVDCTGLRFNCTPTTSLYQGSSPPLGVVGESVVEAAAEAEVPLLKDLPFAQSVSVNLAGRYTDYSINGINWSWKLGADWHLDDSIAFRAATSSDIRAPTLFDLYQPPTITQATFQDLLTGLSPTVPQIGGGNPKLKSEIGRTTTLGAVWTPFQGLSVSFDRYVIHITNALNNVRGNVGLYQNACYASGGSSPACQLQIRPNGFTDKSPANVVQAWIDANVNVAIVKTQGYDLEANYAANLFDRAFTARLLVNNQPQLDLIDPVSGANVLHAGVAYDTGARYAAPKWQVTGLVHYQLMDDFAVDLSEKWRSHLTNQASVTQVWINPRIPTFYTTNLNLTYTLQQFDGQEDVFLNIQNLFDMHPPPAAYYNSPSPGQYGWPVGDDPVGRYFTVGVRAKF